MKTSSVPFKMCDDLCIRDAALELKEEFSALATTLDDYYNTCSKFRFAGAATAVTGGTVAVLAGIAATLSTGGLAAPLAAGATTVATGGGLASGGASLVNYMLKRANLKRTEEKWKSFKMRYYDMDVDELEMEELLARRNEKPSKAEDVGGDVQEQPFPSESTKPSSGPDEAELDLQQQGIQEEPQSFMGAVQSFLKATQVFFDEEKMAESLHRQLSMKGSQLIGISQDEKLSRTIERVAKECGVSEENIREILKAVSGALARLSSQPSPEGKDALEKYTVDEVIEMAATIVAQQCTLSPQKIMLMLMNLYALMDNSQKWNIFGTMAKGGQTLISWTGRAVSSTVTQRIESGMLDALREYANEKAQGKTAIASRGLSMMRTSWLQRGANVYNTSASLTNSLVQKGTSFTRYASSFLPESLTSAGSAVYTTSRNLAGGALAKGNQSYEAAKNLAGGAMTLGGQAYTASASAATGMIQRGGALLPATVASRGSSLYAASKSMAAGAATRGWTAASQAKTFASGWLVRGGQQAAATSKVGGSSTTMMASVSRPMVALNAVFLPLSVYDLVTVSVELRDKKKSEAGEVLRYFADLLARIAAETEEDFAGGLHARYNVRHQASHPAPAISLRSCRY